MNRLLVSSALVGGLVLSTHVPVPSQSLLTFEVASIKRNRSDSTAQVMAIGPGDRVSISNVTLHTIIRAAHQLAPDQLLGGPGWIRTDRFDILAKAEAPVPPDELRMMLRNLLSDRFKLLVHSASKDATGYALLLANRNGQLGPKLRRATIDCRTLTSPARATRPEDTPCGIRAGIGTLAARGLPLEQLVISLSSSTGSTIVDETGLTGFFEWDITFTPQQFLNGQFDRARFPFIDPSGPSIFVAVQEQLGLKLESRKGSRVFLVIDNVAPPEEN